MKPLLAILFSVALVWAQSVPAACAPATSAATPGSGCSCCHCGKTCCCIKNTAPHSEPAPAAPAPQVTQPGQLLLLAPATVAFVLPRTTSSELAHPLSSPSRAAALPLYQQNCAFLL